MNNIDPQTTDMAGAAIYLGMSRSWVRDEIRNGRLPHLRFGRSIRLTFRDLDALISTRHTCDTRRHVRPQNKPLLPQEVRA